MTTKAQIDYVNFRKRSFSFKGDRYTWARFIDGGKKLEVKRAKSGTISSAYENEMQEFCADYGIDFASLRSGEMTSAVL